MSRLVFRAAEPGDDADLRALLREEPMPGLARVAYAREPSYFEAASVHGLFHETILARDADSGELAGFFHRSIRPCFLDGRETPVGYLAGLRVRARYRRGTALARGYRLLQERCADGRASLYLTTVLERNGAALRVLTSRRAGLPAYRDRGRYVGLACGTRTIARAHRPPPGVAIAPAAEGDLPEIASFLREAGSRRPFFPAWTADDLAGRTGLLRGLHPGDIVVARDGVAIVGTAAVWDQRAYRQDVVAGYAPAPRFARPFWNAVAALAGWPPLPPPGRGVDGACLALVAVRGDDRAVFSALLDASFSIARSRGLATLTIGLHERDPLASEALRRPHLAFHSRLFTVDWAEADPRSDLSRGPAPCMELGSL